MTDTAAYANAARGVVSGPAAEAALERFEAIGLPTNKLEDWRYTDLRPLRKGVFKAPGNSPPEAAITLPEPITDWPQLVLLNGRPMSDMSDDLAATGLTVDQSEARAGTPVDGIEALNEALSGQNLAITVAAGAETAKLELTMIFNGASDQAIHVRNWIRVAQGAHLDICLRIISAGQPGWINLVNQFKAEMDSRVRMFFDIAPVTAGFVTLTELIEVEERAHCEHHSLKRGVGSLRHSVRGTLVGSESRFTINGAALAASQQNLATVIEVVHKATNATSQQFFRNVAAGKGTASFQGRIEVREGAAGTDAHQSNKNLLLHRTAKANAKPELLIDTDEVQCSHGTSTGELDPAAIFYMGQRGIPEFEARALLTGAFLADIFERIPNQAFEGFCHNQADPWLADQIGSGS